MGNASSIPAGFMFLFIVAGCIGCTIVSCFCAGMLGINGNRNGEHYTPCLLEQADQGSQRRVIPIDVCVTDHPYLA
jgi:hypothetical protein